MSIPKFLTNYDHNYSTTMTNFIKKVNISVASNMSSFQSKDLNSFDDFPFRTEPCNSKNSERMKQLEDEIKKGNGDELVSDNPTDFRTFSEELQRMINEKNIYSCRMTFYVDFDSVFISIGKNIEILKIFATNLLKFHEKSNCRLLILASGDNFDNVSQLFHEDDKTVYKSFIRIFVDRFKMLSYILSSCRFTNGVILSSDAIFYSFTRVNFAPFEYNKSKFLMYERELEGNHERISDERDHGHELDESGPRLVKSDEINSKLEIFNLNFFSKIVNFNSQTDMTIVFLSLKIYLLSTSMETGNFDNFENLNFSKQKLVFDRLRKIFPNAPKEYTVRPNLLKWFRKKCLDKHFADDGVEAGKGQLINTFNNLTELYENFFKLEHAEPFKSFLEDQMYRGDSLTLFKVYNF